MRKSSIHIKPVLSTSENHNNRIENPHYLKNFGMENEHWSENKIEDRRKEIEDICKNIGGRKLQKNCNPIAEAVVVLNEKHDLADLKILAEKLRQEFNVNVFQIHIHRDEGSDRGGCNYHAHLLIDRQNKTTGKIIELKKEDMIKLQTITADTLQMERGEIFSKAERIEHGKFSQIHQKFDQIEREIEDLIALAKSRLKDEETAKNTLESFPSLYKYASEQIKSQIKKERQMEQIRMGLESKINLIHYFEKGFNAEQVNEIRLGLEKYLDIKSFAKLEIPAEQMKLIREEISGENLKNRQIKH